MSNSVNMYTWITSTVTVHAIMAKSDDRVKWSNARILPITPYYLWDEKVIEILIGSSLTYSTHTVHKPFCEKKVINHDESGNDYLLLLYRCVKAVRTPFWTLSNVFLISIFEHFSLCFHQGRVIYQKSDLYLTF